MESIIRAPIPSSSLISLADARRALAQATDVAAVATLVDRLEVVRLAARKARLSLEAQNDWATLKLEAERKAGGMLTELRRAGELHAGRPNNADNVAAFLSGFGISQHQSSRWQRLSTVPEDAFRAWLEQMTEAGSEVTEVGLTGVAARLKFPEQPYVRPTAMPPGVAPRNVVIEGDCLQVLATLPDSCVDALVTDPPAAVSFMNSDWDSDRGGRDAWVAWMTDVLRESLRVVKPGGYALVWSLPRTSHWTGWALEEAGWAVQDSVIHVFFQGMPKSLDAGKALDRLAGAERPVVGKAPWSQPAISGHHGGLGHPGVRLAPEGRFTPDVTSPATDDAQEWDGWGSGLKPAHEDWWLARKPTDLSVAENLLTWGTGALNIKATRVYGERGEGVWGSSNEDSASRFNASPQRRAHRTEATETVDGLVGRWPANVVLSDSVFDGTIDGVPIEGVVGGGASKGGAYPKQRGVGRSTSFGPGRPTEGGPRQMGDEGGKSRYFVLPKASRRDRDSGVPGARPVQNDHVAVKSLVLMRHLVRLVARMGSLVLDPFAGSGSTGVAAALEGMDYLLVEREREYVAIARARLGLDENGQ
jgi:site-specific DNA-methyltransferase (adenine-specific)